MIDIKNALKKIEFRKSGIISKIKRLRREDPFSTTDRSLIVEPGTDAAALSGHENVVVLASKLKADLAEIEMALKKIKKGTYGVCENCGKKIDANRLSVKPSAIYCFDCEKRLESRRK